MAAPSKLHPADEVTPEGRRQFLRCAAVTGASALVPASLLSACAAAMSFQGVVADGRVRVPADQLAQIEEDAGLLVNAPGLQEKIWLIRSEGEWLAIGAECSQHPDFFGTHLVGDHDGDWMFQSGGHHAETYPCIAGGTFDDATAGG